MNGAALYLHLYTLGLSLRPVDDPRRPDSYTDKDWGNFRLDPDAQEIIRRSNCALLEKLVVLLSSCSPSAAAVRQEGGHQSN